MYNFDDVIDEQIFPLVQFIKGSSRINLAYAHQNRLNNLIKSWFYALISQSMQMYLPWGATVARQWGSLQ